jgi:hypothetical protein
MFHRNQSIKTTEGTSGISIIKPIDRLDMEALFPAFLSAREARQALPERQPEAEDDTVPLAIRIGKRLSSVGAWAGKDEVQER